MIGFKSAAKFRKKSFSFLLCLMLIASILPMGSSAIAAELLNDNFESYSSFPAGSWTNASGNGSWSIATDGSKVARQTTSTSNTYIVTNGSSSWTDYTYSAKVKVGSTSVRNGIVGRYVNSNNYYFLLLYNGNVVLNKKVSGSTSTIQQVAFTANTSTFYELKLEISGTSVKGYVDGVLKVQGTDTSLTSGLVGFYANGVASFDDALVTDSGGVTPSIPAAPTGLSATAGNAQVSLSWNASSGATSYNLLRSTTSGSGYSSVATGLTGTTYTDTGLTNGTTYYYVVTATNSAGTSGNSNQASATPTAAPSIPAAPGGLTASAGDSQVSLSWSPSSGATSYNVLRSTTSGSGYSSVATGLTGTSYTDTGRTNGTTYYYVVTATNSAGTSGNSNQASATPVAPGSGTIVNVSTSAQLDSAISAATAGTTIVLANGTYTKSGAFSVSGKNGTAANPITIKAANHGSAIISGSAYITVTNSSYITIEGLKFTNTGNSAIKLTSSNNIRMTRNHFRLTENGNSLKWLYIGGANSHHNRIDHNLFEEKHDLGNFITFDGSATQISQYDIVEYNHFRNIGPRATNEMEAIRVGWSEISMSDGFITIQYNLFENCDGDPEIVSVKSGKNHIRYNTVRSSQGVISSRHGNGNELYGNYFFGDGKSGTGGIRIYGQDHKVYNNYFEGLTGTGFDATIAVDGGDVDTSGALNAHWRVYRAQIVNNTLVNNATGIEIGKNYSLAPVDSTIANNIITGSSGKMINEYKAPVNMTYLGNIAYPTGSATVGISGTTAQVRNVDPLFTTVNGLQKLSSSSPAINTASGTFTFITEDMDGQSRSTNDVGADEYSTGSIVRAPLTSSQVGVSAP